MLQTRTERSASSRGDELAAHLANVCVGSHVTSLASLEGAHCRPQAIGLNIWLHCLGAAGATDSSTVRNVCRKQARFHSQQRHRAWRLNKMAAVVMLMNTSHTRDRLIS